MPKRCTKCAQDKPLDAFPKGRNRCKDCGRLYHMLYGRSYRVNRRPQLRAYRKIWRQTNGNNVKEAARSKAWREANPGAQQASSQKYYKANRTKIAAVRKARHEANPERLRLSQQRYRAKNTEKMRLQHQAYRHAHPEKFRGYRLKHAVRRKAATKAWCAMNRERVRRMARAYYHAHPEIAKAASQRRRARLKEASVYDLSAAQWREIQEAQDHRCWYCGKRRKGKLTQDHITPVGPEGPHTLHNIIAACGSCNSRKGRKAPLKPVQPLLLTIAPARKKKTS